MAEPYSISAEPREVTGKKVNRLRQEGRTPVVLYGHKVKPLALSVAQGDLEKVYRKAGGSSMVKVKLPDGEHNVLIHQIFDDPVTGKHMHADFYAVRMDEKIKTTIPLVFENTETAPAVRELDGVLLTNLNELEIECLPADLPSEVTVDVIGLETFEDSITVADLKVPEGVTVLNDPETNVASVTPPRSRSRAKKRLKAKRVPKKATSPSRATPRAGTRKPRRKSSAATQPGRLAADLVGRLHAEQVVEQVGHDQVGQEDQDQAEDGIEHRIPGLFDAFGIAHRDDVAEAAEDDEQQRHRAAPHQQGVNHLRQDVAGLERFERVGDEWGDWFHRHYDTRLVSLIKIP